MAVKKRLQVFISSTFLDLKEERQAAVEAVLMAGHIPAGMELFAAGDETQWNVIKSWIDESDVYLLILGGRYGSIEKNSGKSYIQLEYEYALEKGKPLFAVVIEDDHLEEKVRNYGSEVMEKEEPKKYKMFKEFVLTKVVKFWRDPRDIKLSILETLSSFTKRDDLLGWIPRSQSIDTGIIAEEIARLTKENESLRQKLTVVDTNITNYNGISFSEMYKLLNDDVIEKEEVSPELYQQLTKIAISFQDEKPSVLHLLWWIQLLNNLDNPTTVFHKEVIKKLSIYGILETRSRLFTLTKDGHSFLLKVRFEKGTPESKSLIHKPN